MDEIELKAGAKLPAKAIDRVALGKDEAEKISLWLKQLEESLSGFLQLSKSDIVNFLIREQKPELTVSQMRHIRNHHYDPIRHLNWITPQIKLALSIGDVSRVMELQNELRGVELAIGKTATNNETNDDGTPVIVTTKRRSRRKNLDESTKPQREKSSEIGPHHINSEDGKSPVSR